MGGLVKEKSQGLEGHLSNNAEAEEFRQGEAVKQVQPERKRSRKKKVGKPLGKLTNFTLSLDLIERLGYYKVHRERVEERQVTNSEVAEKALDAFLNKAGY